MPVQDTEIISHIVYLTAEMAVSLGENIDLLLEYEAALKKQLQQRDIEIIKQRETALQSMYNQVSDLLSDRSLLWDFTNQYRALYLMDTGFEPI